MIEKILAVPTPLDDEWIKLTSMGNVQEVLYLSSSNNSQTIQMLDKDHVLVLGSGEIKECKHSEKRSDRVQNLYRTFRMLRCVINSNITDSRYVKWCTLTFNRDVSPDDVYQEFRKFNQRFLRYCKKRGWIELPKYIIVIEPQNSGRWHIHALYFWRGMRAPFISNDDFANIWKNGFVTIAKLPNVDNIGAYLTAYLANIPVEEASPDDLDFAQIIECSVPDDDGKFVKKKFIKGGRLHYYPADMRIYRTSRGIAQPTFEHMPYSRAMDLLDNSTRTFESCVRVVDEEKDLNIEIHKIEFNSKRDKSKEYIPPWEIVASLKQVKYEEEYALDIAVEKNGFSRSPALLADCPFLDCT